MTGLPRAAQAFLITVCLLGAACFALSWQLPLPAHSGPIWELLMFVALAAVAGGKKVVLARHVSNEEAGSMSLGFTVTFAALLRFGPEACVLVGAASAVSCGLFPKRQPVHQFAFNTCLGIIESLIGGLTYYALNGSTLSIDTFQTFGAVCASAFTFFAINTCGVATIIALCSGQRAFRVWRENFLWTAPGFLAGASISALAVVLFKSSIPAGVLFVLPVLFLVYHTYVSYARHLEENRAHVTALEEGKQHLSELYLATIKSLALAVDAKDEYTHQHVLRVQKYSVAIAKEMGFTGDELEAINTGALLHDIGKLGVPESVLLKPGKLTDEEFEQIKRHPSIGANILQPVDFPWPVIPIVRHHHEKWDGTGYPDRLKGEEIPLNARIMAVADVYDALTSNRSYREAWSHERAVELIKKDAGRHFDPLVVEAFLRVIDSVVDQPVEEQRKAA